MNNKNYLFPFLLISASVYSTSKYPGTSNTSIDDVKKKELLRLCNTDCVNGSVCIAPHYTNSTWLENNTHQLPSINDCSSDQDVSESHIKEPEYMHQD